MSGEINKAVPGDRARGAERAVTTEALLALCWLLRREDPAGRPPGGGIAVDARVRARRAAGRLASDPGA
jgi:hypothetical protein